jgi:hypothetical protein
MCAAGAVASRVGDDGQMDRGAIADGGCGLCASSFVSPRKSHKIAGQYNNIKTRLRLRFTKTFADEGKAKQDAAKLIAEKLKKGYVEKN